MSLSRNLKAFRTRARESLQQVADAVGASRQHIWELEAGRSTNPSLELLTALARHFKVSITALVDEEDGAGPIEGLIFGRDFRDLSPEDKAFLIEMAERLKSKKHG
jgi:transcriptional regulator with XRE-family HTH domain